MFTRTNERLGGRLLVAWLALCVIGMVAYFTILGPVAQGVFFSAASGVAGAAILVGLAVHRPERRLPWLLLAGFLFFFTVGSSIWYVLYFLVEPGESVYAWSNVAYTIGYVLAIAGLFAGLRSSNRKGSLAAITDATIVVVNVAMLSWTFIMEPLAERSQSAFFAQALELAYPFMDIFVMIAVVALAFATRGPRSTAIGLLLGAFGCMLLSDAVWYWQATTNTYVIGTWVDGPWLVAFFGMGAVGLHGRSVHLFERSEADDNHLSRKRLVWFGLGVSILPALMIWQSIQGFETSFQVLAWSCVGLFTLLLVRLGGLARTLQSAVCRLEQQSGELRRSLRHEEAALVELSRSQDQLRGFAENLDAVLWIREPASGKMVYMSPAYERVWGMSIEQLEEQPRSWHDAVAPSDVGGMLENLERLDRDGTPVDHEFRIHRPDGVRTIRERAFEVRGDSTGRLIAGIAEDVTERKHLEQTLMQSQKMEAVGQLAGGVAHDFNNLLSVILNYISFAKESMAEPEEARKDLDEAKRAAESATRLTRQLLAFSRKDMSQPETLDLNDVVEEMGSMLRRLLRENIDLSVELTPELPLVTIDPTHVEQIVLNLVVNAKDAMPDVGRIEIRSSEVQVDHKAALDMPGIQPGHYTVLTVSDTGSGIAPAHLERIFEPFFTTKEAGAGTGLGLATVYGSVKQAGGYTDVRSEVGSGTTISVYLPCDEGAVRSQEQQTPSAAKRDGEGRTVLVVEDQEAVRNLVQRILVSKGFDVIVAGSPFDALRVTRSEEVTIDLLLSDVIMPGMSGPKLAEHVLQQRPSTPVLFMSGYAEDALSLTNELGSDVLLRKPFTPQEMLDAVWRRIEAPEVRDSVVAAVQ